MQERGMKSFLRTVITILVIFAAFIVYRHFTTPIPPPQNVASKAALNEKRLNEITVSNLMQMKDVPAPEAQESTTASDEQKPAVDPTELKKTSDAFAQEAQKQAQNMNERTKNNGFEVLRQIGVGFQ